MWRPGRRWLPAQRRAARARGGCGACEGHVTRRAARLRRSCQASSTSIACDGQCQRTCEGAARGCGTAGAAGRARACARAARWPEGAALPPGAPRGTCAATQGAGQAEEAGEAASGQAGSLPRAPAHRLARGSGVALPLPCVRPWSGPAGGMAKAWDSSGGKSFDACRDTRIRPDADAACRILEARRGGGGGCGRSRRSL